MQKQKLANGLTVEEYTRQERARILFESGLVDFTPQSFTDAKKSELSHEEQVLMEYFRADGLQNGLRCEKANIEITKDVVKFFYNKLKYKEPEFIHCSSPLEAENQIVALGGNPFTCILGQWDAYWVVYYTFMDRFIKPIHTDEQRFELCQWELLTKNCGWTYTYEGKCFICDRPIEIHQDSTNRLHNTVGPAMLFADGLALWYYHGVKVPQHIIMAPEEITSDQILSEANQEVKTAMIAIMGYDRFIKELGAELVNQDKYGKLWRKEVPGLEEPFLVVEVINSTIEPDGYYKPYFIPVHPELRPILEPDASGVARYGEPQKLTAHAAVASTFGKYAHEYDPLHET